MDDDVIPFIHGQQIFERAPKPLEPLWLESKLWVQNWVNLYGPRAIILNMIYKLWTTAS